MCVMLRHGPAKGGWLMLAGWMQVRQVVETLRCCSHQAFLVTPDVMKAMMLRHGAVKGRRLR